MHWCRTSSAPFHSKMSWSAREPNSILLMSLWTSIQLPLNNRNSTCHFACSTSICSCASVSTPALAKLVRISGIMPMWKLFRKALDDPQDMCIHCIAIQDCLIKLLEFLLLQVLFATQSHGYIPMLDDLMCTDPVLLIGIQCQLLVAVS